MPIMGLNYNDVQVTTRLNGQVWQSQRTKDLKFSVRAVVSYVSRYVMSDTGDFICAGMPATKRAIKPGEVVELEVEGIGILPIGSPTGTDGSGFRSRRPPSCCPRVLSFTLSQLVLEVVPQGDSVVVLRIP